MLVLMLGLQVVISNFDILVNTYGGDTKLTCLVKKISNAPHGTHTVNYRPLAGSEI